MYADNEEDVATYANVLTYEETVEWLQGKNEELSLSTVQYNFLLAQFQCDDENHDLHIDLEELSHVLEGLVDGISDAGSYSDQRCAQILQDFDWDHNGTIEFHEFCYLCLTHADFGPIRNALANIELEFHKFYEARRQRQSALSWATDSRGSSIGIPKTPSHSIASSHGTICGESESIRQVNETLDGSNGTELPNSGQPSTTISHEKGLSSGSDVYSDSPDNNPDFCQGRETIQLRRSSTVIDSVRRSSMLDREAGRVKSILRNSVETRNSINGSLEEILANPDKPEGSTDAQ